MSKQPDGYATMTSETSDTTDQETSGAGGALLSLQTTLVSVELTSGSVRVSCVDDAGPAARGARAVAEWLSDELGEDVSALALPGKVGIELRSGADEYRIVSFAVAALEAVYVAAHPMRRFGELAAGGPVVGRLGKPLDAVVVAVAPPAVEAKPLSATPSAPASATPAQGAAPRVRFEWIGPIATGPIASAVAQASAPSEVGAAQPTGATPLIERVQATFAFSDLPPVDAVGLFDVWMVDAGDDAARTREVLSRVLACDVASIETRVATLPAIVAAGVPAREVRRVEASLRYTTRAAFRASPAA